MEMILWSILIFIWLVSGIKMYRSFYSFNSKLLQKENKGFNNGELLFILILFLIGGWLWMVSAFREKV